MTNAEREDVLVLLRRLVAECRCEDDDYCGELPCLRCQTIRGIENRDRLPMRLLRATMKTVRPSKPSNNPPPPAQDFGGLEMKGV
jgi:hypothetical protein